MLWVGRLISIAVILQTIESFFIPPWSWAILSVEIPRGLRPFVASNRLLLTLRLGAAAVSLVMPSPWSVGVVLLTSWGLAIRWRGNFNGGSDAMTFQIVAAWWVSACWPSLENATLFYIVIQLVFSYGVAGLSKLVESKWRSGQALAAFLPELNLSPVVARLGAWLVIGFECLFPLAPFAPVLFMTLAMSFHFACFYFFGLNRFVFVWLAAYPALILVAGHHLIFH